MSVVAENKMVYREQRIGIWLLTCCVAIFAMVVLGGVTRLTGSGLSMVEWEPIIGILPPLTPEQWMETFKLYQLSPEFKYKNFHMTLEDFKGIFWFEYAHRVLGRTIGVIFFVPMVYFFAKGWVNAQLRKKLITMFILGGLQGLLGWYMVMSGLADEPHVSQYRLTAHLGVAFIIFAYIYWVALGLLLPSKTTAKNPGAGRLGRLLHILSIAVFITVLSGGFVAGTRAGFAYNTFPLMNGQLIPDGLFIFDPVWRNFFENIITIQFDHRLLATLVFSFILFIWFYARRVELSRTAKRAVTLLLLAVCLQVALGVSTLLLTVPVALAAAHQGGAVVLFSVVLYNLYVFKTGR